MILPGRPKPRAQQRYIETGWPDLAEADVQVVVVAGELDRQALADEHRIVEVDELHVARRRGPDRLDQLTRGRAVVRGVVPVRAPVALIVVVARRPDVEVQALLMGLVARDVSAVLERHVAERDPALPQLATNDAAAVSIWAIAAEVPQFALPFSRL